MKIAVCEDNKTEAEWLRDVIQKWLHSKGIMAEIYLYADAASFSFALEDMIFDILFLDIKMPGEDGVTLAKRLRQKSYDMAIVFVTGEKEYILEGYEVDAVNYLIKPVEEERVYLCLNKIYDKAKEADVHIILESASGVAKILQKDIYSVEVYGHTLIYTTKTGKYETTSSLKEAANELEQNWFIQPHRGVLVNIMYVEQIAKDHLLIYDAKNDYKAEYPVSRRCYSEINQAFIKYHKDKLMF